MVNHIKSYQIWESQQESWLIQLMDWDFKDRLEDVPDFAENLMDPDATESRIIKTLRGWNSLKFLDDIQKILQSLGYGKGDILMNTYDDRMIDIWTNDYLIEISLELTYPGEPVVNFMIEKPGPGLVRFDITQDTALDEDLILDIWQAMKQTQQENLERKRQAGNQA